MHGHFRKRRNNKIIPTIRKCQENVLTKQKETKMCIRFENELNILKNDIRCEREA